MSRLIAVVSTDSADQKNSFAAQNTYYTTLVANTKQWTLVDIYADEGITGTSAAKRTDFQRLLSDCRNGLIDKVLVKSISRFARNTKECLEVVRELKSLGIGILFEEQHIDTKSTSSELLTAVMASLAKSESESISQNVRWGIQKKMRDGSYVASHTIFGFRRVEGSLVIHREEAAYVRYMLADLAYVPAILYDNLKTIKERCKSFLFGMRLVSSDHSNSGVFVAP